MKYIYILCLISIVNTCFAQNWYKASIATPTTTGYTSIELTNEFIAISERADLLDIRIKDKSGNEIPFLVRTFISEEAKRLFIEYPLLENAMKNDTNKVIIQNSKKENINKLLLQIKNADVNKAISIRGSNDQTTWFIVKQTHKTQKSEIQFGADVETISIDFPTGNYEYYELMLSNDQKSPLDVLKVGTIKTSNPIPQLSPIDLGTILQKDSIDKKTYICFPDLPYNFKIHKLSFFIKNKENYLRSSIIDNKQSFTLKSDTDNDLYFTDSYRFSPKTSIVIENKDNIPLVFDSIKAYAVDKYLCAYLEEGETYFLTVKENSSIPDYDIANFQKQIPQNLSVLKIFDLQKIDRPESQGREKLWIEKPIILWSIIIIVGFFLLLVCYNMLKDMKNKS